MNNHWKRNVPGSWLLGMSLIAMLPSCQSNKLALQEKKGAAVVERAKGSDVVEESKLMNIIASQLHIDVDKVKSESHLNDLGADSLDIVEIVMEIEKAFGISISDNELENIKKVSDITSIIKNKKSLLVK